MEFIFSFLIFAVALVNGWTDAPSAIAGCVSTRSLTPRAALILAAICNFSGAVIMALIRPGVAKTLYGIADFGSEPRSAMISLCAALISVILWASFASLFGLPTSESHALISGMSGAALASNRDLSAISLNEWRSVIIGILVSTDPVAIDQACVDLVYACTDPGKPHLLERIESRHGIHTIEVAAEHGCGSREYQLIEVE